MMHRTASTSREHFRTFDAGSLHALILNKLKDDTTQDWCIADLASALGLERSTVSGRMNELKNWGELQYTEKKPSKKTGVMAMHFRVKLSDRLF